MRVLLEYQQNFAGVALAIIVIDTPSNDIDVLRSFMPAVRKAIEKAKPGAITHVGG